jgi:hypothetical protein
MDNEWLEDVLGISPSPGVEASEPTKFAIWFPQPVPAKVKMIKQIYFFTYSSSRLKTSSSKVAFVSR